MLFQHNIFTVTVHKSDYFIPSILFYNIPYNAAARVENRKFVVFVLRVPWENQNFSFILNSTGFLNRY